MFTTQQIYWLCSDLFFLERNIWHSRGLATGHTRDNDGRLWRCGLADLMIGVTECKTVELHRVAHLGVWGLIADLKHCGACALWHQMLVLTGTTTCQRRSLPQRHKVDWHNIYFSSTCRTRYQETEFLISLSFQISSTGCTNLYCTSEKITYQLLY